ncbi:macrophage mannose receptor 1-like [Kryptolebias marmoratus]|uniref:macrophage mannose receptor 1-like n=1 Tax=Kryptolebias marmoratus TaxID=37003 RepID=UPI0018ACC0ED|nr:macrophage mannose receptor 1-like [Kryptolebias marmoratus]
MKSSLSGPFLHILFLSSSAFGLTSVVSKTYIHIRSGTTWKNAQTICKTYYTDLATFYTESDLNQIKLYQYNAWIGLHRQRSEGNDWIWTNGNLADFSDEDYSRDCGTVGFDKKFYARPCGNLLFFICQKTTDAQDSPEYYFIPETKTWSQAQTYCQDNYDDLGNLDSYDENAYSVSQDFPVWIGLYKDGGSWNWSTSLSEYVNWNTGEPSNNGDCASVTSVTKRMAVQNCKNNFSFVCMSESVFLVKENKTWDEALDHCRGLPSTRNLYFDLLSVQPGNEHDYVMNKVKAADTEEVWVGLRFLADEWMWVNGAEMLYADLPLCPIQGNHCGVISKKDTGSVKARNCSQKKNFLCYSYKS